jgi:alpha-L-fucosidase 2
MDGRWFGENWQAGDQGHNMSPNFMFYPGSSITLRGTPELAAATLKRMETRRSRGGWPAAWDVCMWARLERGDKVGTVVQTLVRDSLAPNLHNSGALERRPRIRRVAANYPGVRLVAVCLTTSETD